MSVWFAVPSARPNGGTAALWKAKGYKISLWRDHYDEVLSDADDGIAGGYPGYASAVNALCRQILQRDPDAEWIVTGGDDVEPDPNHSPEQIALECSAYFTELWTKRLDDAPDLMAARSDMVAFIRDGKAQTFGVMQCTGDRWGDDAMGRHRWPDAPAYIDRVCGSPWMGREFCRRMYQGQGPLFSGYWHMFEDEELQAVAKRLGVLWQRRDLIQYHRHYAREGHAQPKHLEYVSGPQHWQEAKALFESRRAQGFPGHEPIL